MAASTTRTPVDGAIWLCWVLLMDEVTGVSSADSTPPWTFLVSLGCVMGSRPWSRPLQKQNAYNTSCDFEQAMISLGKWSLLVTTEYWVYWTLLLVELCVLKKADANCPYQLRGYTFAGIMPCLECNRWRIHQLPAWEANIKERPENNYYTNKVECS